MWRGRGSQRKRSQSGLHRGKTPPYTDSEALGMNTVHGPRKKREQVNNRRQPGEDLMRPTERKTVTFFE